MNTIAASDTRRPRATAGYSSRVVSLGAERNGVARNMRNAFMLGFLLLFACEGSTSPCGLNWAGVNGEARGGVLVLCCRMSYGATFIGLRTSEGMHADNLAECIFNLWDKWDTSFMKFPIGIEAPDYSEIPPGEIEVSWLQGSIYTAGSEIGFNIPLTPRFITTTVKQDSNGDRYRHFQWENRDDIHDSICLSLNGELFRWLDKDTTEYALPEYEGRVLGAGKLGVCAIRDCMPSNVAEIEFQGDTISDSLIYPFTKNVTACWCEWNGVNDQQSVKLTEGPPLETLLHFSGGGVRCDISAPVEQTTPFYQVIEVDSSKACGGVYRKYLGLEAGRRYRISIGTRMAHETDAVGYWAFTMHTCALPSGVRNLTNEQFAGTEALPDGSTGHDAGLFMRESSLGKEDRIGDTIERKEEYVTPPPYPPTLSYQPPRKGPLPSGVFVTSTEVQIPEDSETLVVWLRLCADLDRTPSTPLRVEMHSVSLEALGKE